MTVNRYFKLTKEQQALHKILNDTNVTMSEMEVEEVVFELMRVNRAITLLNTLEIGSMFIRQLTTYKEDIFKFLEEIN